MNETRIILTAIADAVAEARSQTANTPLDRALGRAEASLRRSATGEGEPPSAGEQPPLYAYASAWAATADAAEAAGMKEARAAGLPYVWVVRQDREGRGQTWSWYTLGTKPAFDYQIAAEIKDGIVYNVEPAASEQPAKTTPASDWRMPLYVYSIGHRDTELAAHEMGRKLAEKDPENSVWIVRKGEYSKGWSYFVASLTPSYPQQAPLRLEVFDVVHDVNSPAGLPVAPPEFVCVPPGAHPALYLVRHGNMVDKEAAKAVARRLAAEQSLDWFAVDGYGGFMLLTAVPQAPGQVSNLVGWAVFSRVKPAVPAEPTEPAPVAYDDLRAEVWRSCGLLSSQAVADQVASFVLKHYDLTPKTK